MNTKSQELIEIWKREKRITSSLMSRMSFQRYLRENLQAREEAVTGVAL